MKRTLLLILTLAITALLTSTTRAAPPASPQAAAAYIDGLEALSSNKYADAEKSFSAAIAADEENPAYYQARGVARTLNENFAPALKDFQKAARLAPQKDWETTGWNATASKMNGHPEVTFAPATAGKENRDYALALSQLAQNYWQSQHNGSYYDPAQRKTIPTKETYKGDFPIVAKFYVQKHLAGAPGAGTATGENKNLLARIQSKFSGGPSQNLEAFQSLQPLLAANPGDPDLLVAQTQIFLNLNNLEGARETATNLLTRSTTAAAYLIRAGAAAKMADPYRTNRDLALASQLDPALTAAIKKEIPSVSAAPPNPQSLWTQLETEAKSNAPAAQLQQTALALVRAMYALCIRYDERYQDHFSTLEAALKSNPNDPNAQVALARFIHDESKVLEERVGPRAEPKPYRIQSPADLQHDLDRANQLVDTAYKNAPNNIAVLVVKAHFLNDAADYDTAQDVVNHALTIKKDDPDLLEVLASLIQIQAARHITIAGNLKNPKSFSQINFMQSPPMIYEWTIYPSKEDLALAAEHERQANALTQFAMAQLDKAAANGGATAQGYYFRATLLRVRGESAEARDNLNKAVALQPDFQQAWYFLAAVCTDLRDADGAIAARAKAYSLANTTASAQLNNLWYKILHNQFKTARDTVAQGVAIDPADPRLPAYLAVIDEASEKPNDALAHYRMAEALSDATLTLHGTRFAPPTKTELPIPPEDASLPAAIRLRIAALLLDQNQPTEAAAEFSAIASTLAALPTPSAPPDALLPSPDLAPGVVPPAESNVFLQIRATAGAAYANWAVANPKDSPLAAQTFRRLLIAYVNPLTSNDSLKATADLGLAELYLKSSQYPEAAAALKSTPAVPQDLWQEMRQTESQVHAHDHP